LHGAVLAVGAMADEKNLIAAIYDAIIDPSRRDEVVKRIVEDTKSFSGNLVLQQPGSSRLTALYNVDPVIAESYAQTVVDQSEIYDGIISSQYGPIIFGPSPSTRARADVKV
jgi:hypothetical protein